MDPGAVELDGVLIELAVGIVRPQAVLFGFGVAESTAQEPDAVFIAFSQAVVAHHDTMGFLLEAVAEAILLASTRTQPPSCVP